jgi:polar amino acid transport system substrate-binding protein
MRRRSLLFSVCAPFAAPLAIAQDATAVTRPGLRVSLFDGFPPYSYRQGDGLAGILVDAVDELLGGKYAVTCEGYPWIRAQTMVREGLADALITTVAPSRLAYAEASREHVVRLDMRVYFAKTNPKAEAIRRVETVDDLRAFTHVNYAGNQVVATALEGHDINWQSSLNTAIRMLAANRADILVGNDLTPVSVARTEGLLAAIDSIPFPTLPASPLMLLVRKTYPGLREVLADFDAAVRAARADGRLGAIMERYL